MFTICRLEFTRISPSELSKFQHCQGKRKDQKNYIFKETQGEGKTMEPTSKFMHADIQIHNNE